MSKIALEPNASGTGVFSIASPNSNNNRTLTLPDVDGALLTDASSIPAANLTGTLPAIDGSNLTNLPSFSSIQVFEASRTWVKPTGVKSIILIMTGGAGGRGNVENAGAGSTTINFLDVSTVSSATVVVGAGGYADGVNASAGGNTTWADGVNSLTALGGLDLGNTGIGQKPTTGDINIGAGVEASFWGSNNLLNSGFKGAWGSVGTTVAGYSSQSGVVIVLEYT